MLCATQLKSTCHYIVNHNVKILHVRLGGANNMRPLSWGGHKRKRSDIQLQSKSKTSEVLKVYNNCSRKNTRTHKHSLQAQSDLKKNLQILESYFVCYDRTTKILLLKHFLLIVFYNSLKYNIITPKKAHFLDDDVFLISANPL